MQKMESLSLKSFIKLPLVMYWLTANYYRVDFPINLTKSLTQSVLDSFLDFIEPDQNRSVLASPIAFMTTREIIRSRGYPLEVHYVTTQDGYILELHRIPYGKNDAGLNSNSNGTFTRRPVFLQHGMFCTDIVWIFGDSDNSLAFMLADRGYDVWLGNSRGTAYSKQHVQYDAEKDAEYWDHSWDEIGRYDTPATIDYVLNVTGHKKLAGYFGYSLGTTLYFMGAVHNPEINDKVEVMFGVAPSVTFANMTAWFVYPAAIIKPYQFVMRVTGAKWAHRVDGVLHNMLRLAAETTEFGRAFGRLFLHEIYGYPKSNDETPIEILGHYPSGGSVNNMVHLLQSYHTGQRLVHFDYGHDGNMQRYGVPQPPEYNLKNVTTPVYFLCGENDPLAPPADVKWVATQLGNFKGFIWAPDPFFSHGDFIWSPKAGEYVYEKAIQKLSPPFAYTGTNFTSRETCRLT